MIISFSLEREIFKTLRWDFDPNLLIKVAVFQLSIIGKVATERLSAELNWTAVNRISAFIEVRDDKRRRSTTDLQRLLPMTDSKQCDKCLSLMRHPVNNRMLKLRLTGSWVCFSHFNIRPSKKVFDETKIPKKKILLTSHRWRIKILW